MESFPKLAAQTTKTHWGNATEISHVIRDEPSRLVAEFGPREELKSWLDAIFGPSKSCTVPTAVTVEL
ncbi:uncharacterized protein EAF02_006169 [Botrytis sinoallii]|uniref:uncharacterized protein n=1 Tax=Botrytis sinoallii TaxID=1463999 RepID=UPI0018FF7099|nr:uncharacterized protein EAF02_006169 [Botrytis sinoallii]KAF7882806.1 hypothetical protein EAF02_006169 [Botrytis sinoallii]